MDQKPLTAKLSLGHKSTTASGTSGANKSATQRLRRFSSRKNPPSGDFWGKSSGVNVKGAALSGAAGAAGSGASAASAAGAASTSFSGSSHASPSTTFAERSATKRGFRNGRPSYDGGRGYDTEAGERAGATSSARTFSASAPSGTDSRPSTPTMKIWADSDRAEPVVRFNRSDDSEQGDRAERSEHGGRGERGGFGWGERGERGGFGNRGERRGERRDFDRGDSGERGASGERSERGERSGWGQRGDSAPGRGDNSAGRGGKHYGKASRRTRGERNGLVERQVTDVRTIYESNPPIGTMVDLAIVDLSDKGALMDAGVHGELFIPKSQLPEDAAIGSLLPIFLYKDRDRVLATARRPYLELGMTGSLKVNEINKGTAYLELGIPKELVVPVSEQRSRFCDYTKFNYFKLITLFDLLFDFRSGNNTYFLACFYDERCMLQHYIVGIYV